MRAPAPPHRAPNTPTRGARRNPTSVGRRHGGAADDRAPRIRPDADDALTHDDVQPTGCLVSLPPRQSRAPIRQDAALHATVSGSERATRFVAVPPSYAAQSEVYLGPVRMCTNQHKHMPVDTDPVRLLFSEQGSKADAAKKGRTISIRGRPPPTKRHREPLPACASSPGAAGYSSSRYRASVSSCVSTGPGSPL